MNDSQPNPVPTGNSGPVEVPEATCGLCAFHVSFLIKGGPANLGQSAERSECRRFPPGALPILALPADALVQTIRNVGGAPILGLSGVPGPVPPRGGQLVLLQPVGTAPAYPPVPPQFPACGEFTPKQTEGNDNQSMGGLATLA